MNRALIIIVTAVLMVGGAVRAEVQKAPQQSNRIVKTCSVEEGAVADATCRGFIIGVIDLTRLYATTGQVEPAFCIPPEVSIDDSLAVYKAYLDANRKMKHFPATAQAVTAFKAAYPCD